MGLPYFAFKTVTFVFVTNFKSLKPTAEKLRATKVEQSSEAMMKCRMNYT